MRSAGLTRRVIAVLIVAAATACSGQKEAPPPATTAPADDAPIPATASERIGRETVTYVSNIYKYYISYRLLTDQRERRAAAKAAVRKGSKS